jgi:hypothetical protein
MDDVRRKLPSVGDQVRIRDGRLLQARGTVVDELYEDLVLVQWDDMPEPTTHHLGALELDD